VEVSKNFRVSDVAIKLRGEAKRTWPKKRVTHLGKVEKQKGMSLLKIGQENEDELLKKKTQGNLGSCGERAGERSARERPVYHP